MKSTSNQFRAAGVFSGLLLGLVGCTSVSPHPNHGRAPAAPVVRANQAEDGFLPPVVKYAVAPEFPAELRRIGANGLVTVELVVDVSGRVQEPKVIEASDDCLISPALHAIWRWEFQPAMRGGKPLAVKVTIPVRFEIAPDRPQGPSYSVR